MSADNNSNPTTKQPAGQNLSYLAKLPSVASPIQIDGTDVIKIVQQFLSESGLHRTLRALQDETDVRTNSVDDVQRFYNDIATGQWQSVLSQLHNFSLSTHLLLIIYDQIILELCEIGEFDTAKHIFGSMEIFKTLEQTNKERYNTIDRYINQHITDERELYSTIPRNVRRQKIIDSLKNVVVDAPKNRLYQIISYSLRYQQLTGLLPQHITDYNFYKDKLATHSIEEQRPAVTLYHEIDCNVGALTTDDDVIYVNTALFTTNGRYLITGNSIGLIEVWDYDRGKLAVDLEYQVNEQYMMHLHPITALAVSNDSELLASASSNGDIRVWSILTGKSIVTIRQAHSHPINQLQFSIDGLLLLSSAENEVKSWNLQNPAVVITYTTQNPVVYCCYPSFNLQQLVSNTILILDNAGTYYLYTNNDLIMKKQLMTTLSPKVTGLYFDKLGSSKDKSSYLSGGDDQSAHRIELYSAQPIRIRPDIILLASRGDNALYTLSDQSGDVLAMYTTAHNPKQEPDESGKKVKVLSEEKLAMFNTDLLHVCTSALAKYIYAVSPSNVLYVFHFETKKIEKIFSPHGNNVILSICHHPFRNLFVTTSLDGTIKIWR